MIKHFYFIRHGQSQANSEKTIAQASSPITSLGISQAKEVAFKLARLNIDLIVSSPMTRAIQTAETIAESIGYGKSKIVTINELRERGLGELEGNPKGRESRWYFDTPNGYGIETHVELYDRIKIALQKIIILGKNYSNILIVGHSISGDMLRLITDNKTDFSLLADYELTQNAEFFELNLNRELQ